jgi:hypothetical protein
VELLLRCAHTPARGMVITPWGTANKFTLEAEGWAPESAPARKGGSHGPHEGRDKQPQHRVGENSYSAQACTCSYACVNPTGFRDRSQASRPHRTCV